MYEEPNRGDEKSRSLFSLQCYSTFAKIMRRTKITRNDPLINQLESHIPYHECVCPATNAFDNTPVQQREAQKTHQTPLNLQSQSPCQSISPHAISEHMGN